MKQGLEGQTNPQISKELGGRSIFPDPLHSLLQNAGSVSWLGFHVVFRGVFIVPAALPPKCIAPTAGRHSSSAVVNPSPGACPAVVISVDCSFVAAQASKQHCHPLGTCLLPLFFALQDLITIVHNRRLLQETSVRVEQMDEIFYFGKFKIDPSEVFLVTDHSYAFVNLKPVVPGHILFW